MSRPESEADIVVGTVAGAFGIRGEVKVRLETDFPERLAKKGELVLEWPDGKIEKRRLVSVRIDETQYGIGFLKFEGIDDRDTASSMRGTVLRIYREQCEKLPEGHYYLHELVGLAVETTDGRKLGKISEVQQHPANDVYVVGNIMIPALKSVVKEIDIAGGRMVINPVPGLLEEER